MTFTMCMYSSTNPARLIELHRDDRQLEYSCERRQAAPPTALSALRPRMSGCLRVSIYWVDRKCIDVNHSNHGVVVVHGRCGHFPWSDISLNSKAIDGICLKEISLTPPLA